MAFGSHRLATVVVGTALAVVSGLAGPIGAASASDPVVSDPAPSLLAPADDPAGAHELKDVVLKWSAVAHADSYQVQISPNGDWTNNRVTLANGGMTVNTTYEVPISLPHAFYFWRVRGFHGTAHTSWSSTRTFLREWYAPFQMLKLPSDTDPTLSWQPVEGASLYRVRFSTSPDFSPLKGQMFTCYTGQTTFTPYGISIAGAERLEAGGCFDAAALTDGTKYYWELVAYDDSTDAAIVADTAPDGGWECAQAQPECDTYMPANEVASPFFTFKAPAPGAFGNGVPTGLKTSWHAASATATDCTGGVCPITPTFSWNPVPGANRYEVHIWRDPRYSNTYRVYETSYTSVTPREGLFDAQAGIPYYWSVRASAEPVAAAAPAASPTCPAAAAVATPPTVDAGAAGMSATPAGPNGAQSMSTGDTATVTLTGTGFGAGACVSASSAGGAISNIAVVDANHVTFNYVAPSSAMSVTFSVVNADGGTSNASAPLDVFAPVDSSAFGPLAAASMFKKRSGPVALLQPTDGSTTDDASVTFTWRSYLDSGSQGSYDVRNYHLQVARDADFDHVVWDNANIDLTQYSNADELLPDGTWYWRVQGFDESDNDLTWSQVSSFTKDSTGPALHLANADGVAVNGRFTIKASEPVNGMSGNAVQLVAATGGPSVSGTLTRTAATTWKLDPDRKLATGEVYRLSVSQSVQDAAGNPATVTGNGVRTSTSADDKGPALSFEGSWSSHVSSQALGGTFHSGDSGRSVKVRVAGDSVKVFGCRGPRFGALSVVVDGSREATVNEHLSYTKCGVVLWKSSLSTHSAHTVKLVATSGAGNVDQVRVG